MQKGSLTIVGSGIKFMSHLTLEAKIAIEQADKVLYLVNEPAMKQWLLTYIKDAESLEDAYLQNTLRRDTYHAITRSILKTLQLYHHVCVVLEGHPIVFAKPALDAVVEAKKQGYRAIVLPGISAEAYLFADLLIDPGTCGCQSYEATDFLIHRREFNSYSHLILLQISVIGLLTNNKEYDYKKGIQILIKYLNRSYALGHQVVLYEGSQYPHIPSKIMTLSLKDLATAPISRMTTLYVPPIHNANYDLSMINELDIDMSQLTIKDEYFSAKKTNK